jgi:FtsP/CotA-like multicopper oxidase with cupredoxin domain
VNHPIHLHGHDFWVIGQDASLFDINTVTFNFANPPRRDVAILPANGYLAIAFKLDNPGTWLMHCHIAWHASEGLALQFVENESQVAPLITAATESEEGCAAWDAYVPVESYPPDDSGI